jgi:hypothetical protein
MRLVYQEMLINSGAFAASDEWRRISAEVRDAVTSVSWPPGSANFTISPNPHGNGVKPIKDGCMTVLLERYRWSLEESLNLRDVRRPGKVDAMRQTSRQPVILEWETGNISSSHRALNKIALGLIRNVIWGGILVLPTRTFYRYLTDRVGNFEELLPYFPVWRSLPITDGLLIVMGIEYDATDTNAPLIRKGTDGRALV